MTRSLLVALLAALTIGCAYRSRTAADVVTPSRGAAPSQWSSVETLRSGSSVAVALFTRELVRGQIVTADDRRIVISSDGRTFQLPRSDVQRVELITGVTRGTRAKRGFLVGAAAGGLVGAFTVKSNQVPWTLMLAAGWGALGALLAALDGSDRTRTMVYESSQPHVRDAGESRLAPRHGPLHRR